MLNQIKNVCSWVVSQVKAGVIWVKNNWPAIQVKAESMARRAYEVAMDQIRGFVVAFERGMVIGIETVEKRQAMPFQEALAEAKAAVKAMSNEQVCAYAAHWFRQEAAQSVTV